MRPDALASTLTRKGKATGRSRCLPQRSRREGSLVAERRTLDTEGRGFTRDNGRSRAGTKSPQTDQSGLYVGGGRFAVVVDLVDALHTSDRPWWRRPRERFASFIVQVCRSRGPRNRMAGGSAASAVSDVARRDCLGSITVPRMQPRWRRHLQTSGGHGTGAHPPPRARRA